MKFSYFKFENFKGIKSEKLDFKKNPTSKVFTLVGLNESGKTTILEAINFFKYNPESLSSLNIDNYDIDDIHNLVPIGERDNFNGWIVIEGGIELNDHEINKIKLLLKKENISLESYSKDITYTQKYFFKNSRHISSEDKLFWHYEFYGKKGKGKTISKISNADAQIINKYVKDNMPSILYFPNFLFEFPEKIYLSPVAGDQKQFFYKNIIQDILDSLGNDTLVETHLSDRITSNEDIEKRNLNSLVGKMESKLSSVIFSSWNQILNKQIKNTEIKLFCGVDENGPYLEFNIKDNIDTYKIGERSLGFRWFFVYILFTQFRTHRKGKDNVLFLFDEPAFNLHPSAQTELLKSFDKLPMVVYSTHSHYLINPKWLESTFIIKNEAIDYDQEEYYNPKNTNIKIFKYRNFVSEYPSETSYFQPVLDTIDFRPSSFDFKPYSILTEGKNDYYTISYFIQNYFADFKYISIVPCTSSSNMDNLISLFVAWDIKFIAFLDSDREGLSQKNRYIKNFGAVLEDKIYTYADIDPTWTNFKSETLIDKIDQLKINNEFYPGEESNKKNLNNSIQELFIHGKVLDFEESTKNNLLKLLNFFKNIFERTM